MGTIGRSGNADRPVTVQHCRAKSAISCLAVLVLLVSPPACPKEFLSAQVGKRSILLPAPQGFRAAITVRLRDNDLVRHLAEGQSTLGSSFRMKMRGGSLPGEGLFSTDTWWPR